MARQISDEAFAAVEASLREEFGDSVLRSGRPVPLVPRREDDVTVPLSWRGDDVIVRVVRRPLSSRRGCGEWCRRGASSAVAERMRAVGRRVLAASDISRVNQD